MHIGLLGGTFDPPHNGHVLIASYVLQNTVHPVDEVWFVPTYEQKYFGEDPTKIASRYDIRLEMTKCLTDNIPHTNVCTLEEEHHLSGQTKDLFLWLPKEHTYCFIIGTDQLASFHRWSEYKTLLQRMTFLVYPREGYKGEPLYEGMTLLDGDAPVTGISSTMVREKVNKGEPIDEYVLPCVRTIIARESLYRKSGRKEQ